MFKIDKRDTSVTSITWLWYFIVNIEQIWHLALVLIAMSKYDLISTKL